MKRIRRPDAFQNSSLSPRLPAPTPIRGNRTSLRRAQQVVMGGGLAAILALSVSAYWVASALDAHYLERERRLLKGRSGRSH